MTLAHNINRHLIAMYLEDAWCIDIDEYQDYSNSDLLNMLKERGLYDEFIGYAL